MRDGKLSVYEGGCMFCLLFLYNVFYEVFPGVATQAGTAGWMAQLIAAIGSAGYFGLFLWLVSMHKGGDLLDIIRHTLGKFLSGLIYIILFIYAVLYGTVCLNMAVNTLRTYSYSRMGALYITLALVAAVAVFGVYSIHGLAKAVSVLLPIFTIGLLLVLLFSSGSYDPGRLNPVLGYGMAATAKTGTRLLSGYNGMILMGLFSSSFASGRDLKKAGFSALLIGSAISVAAMLCYSMAVSYDCAAILDKGILGLAQTNRGVSFIQRMESIYIVVIAMAIVLISAASFLAAKKTCCRLLRINKKRSGMVVIPLALIYAYVCRLMDARPRYGEMAERVIQRDGAFIILPLIVLLIVAGLLRKLAKRVGGKIKRAGALMLLLFFIAAFAQGCSAYRVYREPDAEINPVILGYDKGDKEKYKITLRVMAPGKSDDSSDAIQKGEKAGQETAEDMITVEASSLPAGIALINASVPQSLSLMHVKMLVISEALAREGIDGIVSAVMGNGEIKPTMALAVCRGTAYDFISAETTAFSETVQAGVQMILERGDGADYIVTPLADVFFKYKSGYGDAYAMYGGVSRGGDPQMAAGSTAAGYLPGELPVSGKNKLEFAGAAVLHGDKMVGALNTQECGILNLLTDGSRSSVIVVPDGPETSTKEAALSVSRAGPVRNTAKMDDGVMRIDIKTTLVADILTASGADADHNTDAGRRQKLAGSSAAYLNQQAKTLMDKLQNDFNADVLQLGMKAARNFRTIGEWEAYNWGEKYKDARINVEFIVKIER